MSTPAHLFDRRRRIAAVIALSILAVGGGSLFLWYKIARDPRVIWLSPSHGAQWIQPDLPIQLGVHSAVVQMNEYRTQVDVPAGVSDAELTVLALRTSAVFWDHKLVQVPRPASEWQRWKEPQVVSLKGRLTPGKHELLVQVLNNTGPSVLLAYCEPLGIATGPSWEARQHLGQWVPAATADEIRVPEVARLFPPVHTVVKNSLIWILGTFLAIVGIIALLVWGGPAFESTRRLLSSPSVFRWIVFIIWLALLVNNHLRLPMEIGFDLQGHWKYIDYVESEMRIPLATEGWQMFQSPLYYILTAVMHAALSLVTDTISAGRATRLIPLVCGLLQVEVCYRAMRSAFPDRNDLQCLGTLLGPLLPINLYMSQGFGNEPLNSFFTACAVAVSFRFLRDPATAHSGKWQVLLGAFLGLGMLTKITPLILIPPTLVLFWFVLRRAGASFGTMVLGSARMLGMCAAVTGWYYFRNWLYLGTPFLGGWDQSRGIEWWQYPGYRTLKQFTTFGEVLDYPVYAAYRGIWDGLYSTFWLDGYLSSRLIPIPPWNYDAMLISAWLGLIPMLMMFAGVAAILRTRRPTRDCLIFSVVCIGIYFAALLYMNLHVPFFAHAKSTVTGGLIPCYAALAVAGFDLIARNKPARVLLAGLIGTWAACSYVSYFVLI